jgi:hypothetical protein
MALNRRAFVAATAASVVAPTVARAKECPAAGMDWMTMSLEARNLAYFNVAQRQTTSRFWMNLDSPTVI